jgi:hypothetical protein
LAIAFAVARTLPLPASYNNTCVRFDSTHLPNPGEKRWEKRKWDAPGKLRYSANVPRPKGQGAVSIRCKKRTMDGIQVQYSTSMDGWMDGWELSGSKNAHNHTGSFSYCLGTPG